MPEPFPVRAKLELLHERAKERPPGYVESFLAVGVVDGDFIEIPANEFAKLVKQWSPPPLLGDRIDRLVKPMAILFDRWLGTKLAGCSACSSRRQRLNRWHCAVRARLRGMLAQ